jgi:hypothetical protein
MIISDSERLFEMAWYSLAVFDIVYHDPLYYNILELLLSENYNILIWAIDRSRKLGYRFF